MTRTILTPEGFDADACAASDGNDRFVAMVAANMSAQPTPEWDDDELARWDQELFTWQPTDPAPATEESWRPFPVYRDEQTWEPHIRLSLRAARAIRAWVQK